MRGKTESPPSPTGGDRAQETAPRRRLRTLLAAAVAVVATAGAVGLMLKLDYLAWDFRNNLWGPAHLLIHGQSPYRIEALFDNSNAIWFPPAIGLFFPLAWLDLRWATNLWFLGNLLLGLTILWWSRREESAPLSLSAVILLALIVFPPVLAHFILGQFGLLATFLLLTAAHFVARRRFLAAGLLLAVTLAKPQLAVLVAPGLAVACVRQGGKRGLLVYLGATILGTALLTVPLWLGYPAWMPDFLQALGRNSIWLQPTLFTMFRLAWGPVAQIVPVLFSLGLLVLTIWLWRRYPPVEAMPWTLGLTILATPYVWTWDLVLLLPLVFRSLFRQRSWVARATWGFGYALCWSVMTWIRLRTNNSDHRYFWLPWFIFLLILGGHLVENRFSPAGRQPLLRRTPPAACRPRG